MSKRTWAKIVAIAVAASWGVSFISIHQVKDDLAVGAGGPSDIILPFFLARFAITSLCFLPVAIIGRREIASYDRRTWAWVVGLGLLLGPGYHLPLNYSSIGTPSALMSLMVATAPVMTAILARIFLAEGLSVRRVAGIMLSAAGVAVAVLFQSSREGGLFELGGGSGRIFYPMLAVGAALAASLWAVCGRAALKERNPVVFVAAATIVATILTSFLWSPRAAAQVFSLSGWGWAALVYLAVVATFLAYIGWYWSLRHLQASELTVFVNIVPAEALVLGALVRDEHLSVLYLAGAVMIVAGVYLAQRSSASASAESA